MLACLCADPWNALEGDEVHVSDDNLNSLDSSEPPQAHVQPKMSSLVPLKTVDEEDDAPPAFVATVSDEQQQVFTIAFSKSHGHAGIKFAHVDGLLVVEDIGADYIAQWNSMQKDNMVRVQPMDRVVAINEKWGTAEELLDLFREEGDVELTLEHPRHLSIELHRGKTKAGRKIGLEVSACDGPLGIVILKVLEEGLIPSYNSTAEKGMDIKAYSSIYAINGKAWPSLTLLRMLEKLEVFKVSLRTWTM